MTDIELSNTYPEFAACLTANPGHSSATNRDLRSQLDRQASTQFRTAETRLQSEADGLATTTTKFRTWAETFWGTTDAGRAKALEAFRTSEVGLELASIREPVSFGTYIEACNAICGKFRRLETLRARVAAIA